MAITDGDEPQPNAPGYGDQGPAGAGRKEAPAPDQAKDEEDADPVNDLGG